MVGARLGDYLLGQRLGQGASAPVGVLEEGFVLLKLHLEGVRRLGLVDMHHQRHIVAERASKLTIGVTPMPALTSMSVGSALSSVKTPYGGVSLSRPPTLSVSCMYVDTTPPLTLLVVHCRYFSPGGEVAV